MSRADNFKKAPTLCWDCKWAVYQDKCPWSDHLEPVEGWGANKQKVSRGYLPYASYHVWRCPMFKRDAENGGRKKHYTVGLKYMPLKRGRKSENSNSDKRGASVPVGGVAKSDGDGSVDFRSRDMADKAERRQRVLDQPHRDVLDLSFLILERAVEDWKALDRGARKEVMVDKEIVEREEVVKFFFSDWFKELCVPTGYTPKQIRRFIQMPEDALEIIARLEEGGY